MTAKEYLMQAYKIERRINIINDKIAKLRSQLEYKGISYDGSGASHSGSSEDMSDVIIKISEYEERNKALADKLICRRLEIENVIENVQDDVQREVLERRYLLYQSWESGLKWRIDQQTGKRRKVYVKGIAEDMGYSVQHIYRLHGMALKKVIIPEKYESERELQSVL